MSLRDASKTNLVDRLSKLAGVTLDPATLTLSAPLALSGDSSGLNTQVKVTALSTSPYQGSARYKYNRLKLDDLPGLMLLPLRVSMIDPTTVYGLLPVILKQTGLNFSEADLENASIVSKLDGSRTLVLKAKSTSLVWQGSCTLTLGNLPLFSGLFSSDVLNWS